MSLTEQLEYIKRTMPEAYNYITKMGDKLNKSISPTPRLPLFDDEDEVIDWQGR
jgi:hypothetical protein